MSLLTNASGQVQVDVSAITPDVSAAVQALSLLPNIDGGRKIKGQLYVLPTDPGEVRLDFVITIRDIAFEEFGVYGDRLDPQDRRQLALKF